MSCIVILFSTSCIHQNFNIKKRIYFSEDVFKNWQLNTAITSDEKRKHFIKGNKGVEIYYFPNDSLIQVRAYNAVTTYDIFCLYHLRTKHQLQVGQGICNNPYGITKYYDKKGILSCVETYENNELNGKTEYYDVNGKLEYFEIYKDGKLENISEN